MRLEDHHLLEGMAHLNRERNREARTYYRDGFMRTDSVWPYPRGPGRRLLPPSPRQTVRLSGKYS